MEIALEEADRELELASTCGSETEPGDLGFAFFLRRGGAALSLIGPGTVLVRVAEDGFLFSPALTARGLLELPFL